MRLLGVGTCLVIGGLHLFELGGFNGWHIFLLVLALVYPHLSRYLSRRIEARKRLEYASVLVDAFILGSTVYVAAFSDVVMLSLLTVALANGMALGGARLMAACVLTSGLGIGLPLWSQGTPPAANDLVVTSIIASVFLLFYFIMFASVANQRARLLRASRHQVRQQKADIEIEKRKSDGLLWALVPSSLVNALHAGREPAAREHENVTVLAARVIGIREQAVARGAGKVFAELDHCLKAFDEICQRHGFEPYRLFGDRYFAVAGAPEEKSADADAALRELQGWVVQRGESQAHNDGVALAFAFAARSGPALGGIVHARRFGFELCGDLLGEAFDAVATANRETARTSAGEPA